MGSEEVMFPTEPGAWVILKDGTFGNISLQTPDQVLLKTLGGSQVYFQTTQFLSLFPENLSHGFFVEITLRVDYQFQKKVLELLPFLKRGCEDKLERNETFEGKIKTLFVEFKAQGQHAFELWVRVDADGSIARERFTLERFVHQVFLELCNEKEILIPIEQLKIHTQNLS